MKKLSSIRGSASVAGASATASKAERRAPALAEALRAALRIVAAHGVNFLTHGERAKIRAAEETLSAWDLLP